MAFDVVFWGVRGSFPCAQPSHMKYGGNTSCVELRIGQRVVIFDAGTGLWALGKDLLKRGVTSATLLMSHSHLDHIMGFPFFAPAWMGVKFNLQIMAGHLKHDGGVRSVFEMVMLDPVFPVTLNDMGGASAFHDFEAGETLDLGDGVIVKTAPLNHPNGATGYRIEADGKVVCYITDTEHLPGRPDATILELMRGADLVIYDSTYTDEEFPKKVGWGHSTWEEAVRLAQAAAVKQLAIFHHDPEHDDAVMDRIAEKAKALFSGAFIAQEGVTITL